MRATYVRTGPASVIPYLLIAECRNHIAFHRRDDVLERSGGALRARSRNWFATWKSRRVAKFRGLIAGRNRTRREVALIVNAETGESDNRVGEGRRRNEGATRLLALSLLSLRGTLRGVAAIVA